MREPTASKEESKNDGNVLYDQEQGKIEVQAGIGNDEAPTNKDKIVLGTL